jgi:hypothetical protein
MKQLEIQKYLFDINEACELLVRFTIGKTFSDYSADPMLRSAVERQFEIIGEALAQLLRLDPSLRSRISDAGRIIAFQLPTMSFGGFLKQTCLPSERKLLP